MESIVCILICLTLGMVLGFFRRGRPAFLHLADRAALFAVYGLLFILGAGLGGDAKLLASLPVLGVRGLVTALFCVAGSIAGTGLLVTLRLFPVIPVKAGGPAVPSASPLSGTLRILAFFASGVGLGYLNLLPQGVISGNAAVYALYVLVFAVGIGLGADLKAFRIVRDMRLKILLVPAFIIAGTGLGAAAAALALPDFSLHDALCVGAGFGYYSLSSILIENSGNSSLASVALIANIAREALALLSTPLLARFFGGLAPVAAAGATAMDTTLPGIARFCGERHAVIAVFSGMSLTLLVPFLVAAMLQWR